MQPPVLILPLAQTAISFVVELHENANNMSTLYDNDVAAFQFDQSLFDLTVLSACCLVFVILYSLSSSTRPVVVFGGATVLLSLASVGVAVVKLVVSSQLRRHGATLFALVACLVIAVITLVVVSLQLAWTTMCTVDPDTQSDAYVALEEDEEKKEPKGASLGRLLQLVRPERDILAMAIVALLLASSASIFLPSIFSGLIPVVGKPHGPERTHELNHLLFELVIVSLISSLFAFFRAYLFTMAGERIVARLRANVFDAVIHQDVEFFDTNASGELQSRLSNDTTVIQDALTVNVSMGLRFSIQAVASIVILFAISWDLTLVMLCVIPPLAIGIRVYGSFIRDLSKSYQDALGQAAKTSEEAFSSIRTVRSFSCERHEVRKFESDIYKSFVLGKRKALAQGSFFSGISVAVSVAVVLIAWYGCQKPNIGPKELSSFLLYTVNIASSLSVLGSLYSSLMTAVGASERMFELLDKQPLIDNRCSDARAKEVGERSSGEEADVVSALNIRYSAKALQSRTSLVPSKPITGRIEFREVSFSYPSRPDMQVLNNISFVCESGQVTALVGPSGSGKSTCIALLEHFYDPLQGEIRIDENPLSRLESLWLHSNVALVSQEPILFAMSIIDNIRYGVHRDVTLEEVQTVAKMANAHDFVSQFPDGYNTMVGERGVQLSGGQKQRIAIARAILVDPKILLLDEATSALDSESEHLVQEALDRVMDARTTLVIAHRLSTVKNAGKILVLDGGEIIEQGKHADLLKQDGMYASLVNRQLQA